ncbi:MAG: hypothetical protein ACOCVF_01340 [bacterium]
MAYYRITSLTKSLPKRHPNANGTLDINYIESFEKKVYKLRPGEEMILECNTLPIGIRSLKLRGLVTVKQINENQFLFETGLVKSKPAKLEAVEKEEKKVVEKEEKPKSTKKSYNKSKSTTTTTKKVEEETDEE